MKAYNHESGRYARVGTSDKANKEIVDSIYKQLTDPVVPVEGDKKATATALKLRESRLKFFID
jgi:hypothetical protein